MRLIVCVDLFLLVALVATPGCDKAHPSSAPASSIQVSGTPPPAFKTGIIRTRQWKGNPMLARAVTFWIGDGRIRRETVPDTTAGAAITSFDRSGVIVDLRADLVTLYAQEGDKKRATTMNLQAYRELCAESFRRDFLEKMGVGTIFVLATHSSYRAENSTGVSTVNGYLCDRLLINSGDILITVIEADHSPQLKVDRELLGLVELELPAELVGFPLAVRRTDGVRIRPVASSPDGGRIDRLLARGSKLVAEAVDDLLKTEQEVQEVKALAPDPDWFSLPDEFEDVADVDALKKELDPPPSESEHHHRHHWDWD